MGEEGEQASTSSSFVGREAAQICSRLLPQQLFPFSELRLGHAGSKLKGRTTSLPSSFLSTLRGSERAKTTRPSLFSDLFTLLPFIPHMKRTQSDLRRSYQSYCYLSHQSRKNTDRSELVQRVVVAFPCRHLRSRTSFVRYLLGRLKPPPHYIVAICCTHHKLGSW